MKLLLDTHIIIWALTNDKQLSLTARELISSPHHIVLFSSASIWEIAIKNQKSPNLCPYHEKDILVYCQKAGYEQLNITPEHALAIRNLQVKTGRRLNNYDPFDRILIAQAKTENCLLLTHDSNFENYNEPCIQMV
ncbi:MAG: type II toxin-antitoxin system VapC family toxin [Coriobacteriales bacterium]|nr:type II toxin-antitoxin system VapC family toxin [Coriobacteriales bacterium]